MTTLPKIVVPVRRSLLHELFVDNPMFDEAIRARRRFQRGGATAGPALYYSVIGLIVLAYLWSIAAIIHGTDNVTIEISYFELIVVTLAMPLSLYGAIAGERERATWEALVLTRLTPGQIVAGKLTWRITVTVTLMVILSVLVMVGEFDRPTYGVWGTLRGQSLVLIWGIFLGALTLLVSSISKRSVTALGITFITLVAALLLFPLLASMFGAYSDGQVDITLGWRSVFQFLIQQNPFVALSDVFTYGPTAHLAAGDVDLSGHTYLYAFRFVPTADIVYAVMAILCVFLSYRVLKRLEAPQETERAYTKRFRDEIGPHMAIGVVTAIAFCLFTYKISDGDIGLVITTTVVGLIAGAFCAWCVSRMSGLLKRKRQSQVEP